MFLALLEQGTFVFVRLTLWGGLKTCLLSSLLLAESCNKEDHCEQNKGSSWGFCQRLMRNKLVYLQLRALILWNFLVLISSSSNSYQWVDIHELKGFRELEVPKFASLQEQILTFWNSVFYIFSELLKIFINGNSIILPGWLTEQKNKSLKEVELITPLQYIIEISQ